MIASTWHTTRIYNLFSKQMINIRISYDIRYYLKSHMYVRSICEPRQGAFYQSYVLWTYLHVCYLHTCLVYVESNNNQECLTISNPLSRNKGPTITIDLVMITSKVAAAIITNSNKWNSWKTRVSQRLFSLPPQSLVKQTNQNTSKLAKNLSPIYSNFIYGRYYFALDRYL